MSSCRVAIAIPQDRIVPILSLLAAGVIASMPNTSMEEKGLAVISAVVMVTLITGLFLYALGPLRFGKHGPLRALSCDRWFSSRVRMASDAGRPACGAGAFSKIVEAGFL